MNVSVNVSGTDRWLCQQTVFPEQDLPHLAENRNRVCLPDGSTITDEQTIAGHFLLCAVGFDLNSPVELEKQVHGEAIQLHFSLDGTRMVEASGRADERIFAPNQHSICYQPDSNRTYRCLPESRHGDYFTVFIPREVYSQLLGPESSLHPSFSAGIRAGQPLYLTPRNLPLTPVIRGIIRDIRQCPRTGDLKKLFLESKVIELLMLQLEQVNALSPKNKGLKQADQQKVREAKCILEEAFQTPPTIGELARLVGLNECKLKRGFREQTGDTIYGFVVKLRMEQAYRWLLEGEKSIGEIAHLVGYRTHAHFTAAFKRVYRQLPSELL